MQRSGTLQVSLPSDTDILMTRVFSAPRRLVFAALTRAELLRQWFGGPPGWRLDVCEFDARIGGTYRYVWAKDSGEIMGMGGIITEFDPPARLVSTEQFDQAWYEGQGLVTIDLHEADGRTTLELRVRYESKAIRDHVLTFDATSGVELSYDNLAAWLATDTAKAVQM